MRKKNSNLLPVFLAVLILLAVGAAIWYFRQSAAPVPSAADNSSFFGGLPRATEAASEYTLLTNRAYVVGYSETRKDPLFSAYHLRGRPAFQPDKRPGKFSTDARTAALAASEDYNRSGYDRGHMTPNHVIDIYFGPDAQLETFLMSNVVPQRPTLNRDVWEKIEALEADTYEPEFGEMWVVVGPIFGAQPPSLPAGEQIPSACFRIWVRQDAAGPQALAFIAPNEGLNGKERPAQFVSTVKEIEEQTHLDFFGSLDGAEKARLETEKTGLWP